MGVSGRKLDLNFIESFEREKQKSENTQYTLK